MVPDPSLIINDVIMTLLLLLKTIFVNQRLFLLTNFNQMFFALREIVSVKSCPDVGNKTGGDSRSSPVTGGQKKKVAPNRVKGILHVFPDEVSLFQAFR